MKFSVVTITYNAAASLQRTLDSVARQSYTDIEHLIIDGASTDDTLPMAQRYRERTPYPVVVQSEPDGGLYDAMNKGLRLCTGDYVIFLNAGDAFHDADTLKTVAQAAQNGQRSMVNGQRPAVIYGDTAITDAQGRFLHLRRLRPPRQLTWRSFRQGMLVCHQAFYARTDIARQTPYDLQYRYSADVDWCIRIMKEADRMGLPLVNTNSVLADFEEGGSTTQHHRASLIERFRVMVYHYGLLQTAVMHLWFIVRVKN